MSGRRIPVEALTACVSMGSVQAETSNRDADRYCFSMTNTHGAVQAETGILHPAFGGVQESRLRMSAAGFRKEGGVLCMKAGLRKKKCSI